MKRKLLWIGAAVVTALAIAFLVLRRDEAPPDLSGLRPVYRDVPEASNGFAALGIEDDPVAAEGEEDEEAHLARSGLIGPREKPGLLTAREREACAPTRKDWDPALARKVVGRCGDVLGRLEEALGRPDFQVPRRASPTEPVSYLMALRDRAFLLAARSALRIDAGEDREGFEDATRLVRFGRAIERAQGEFVVYLVGLFCERSGLEVILRNLARTKLSAADIRPVIAGLEPLRADRDAWKEAIRADSALLVELIDGSAEWP